ncbi:MAG: MFS transporter [Burkholderiaceae bacterium]|nr:MFS transporter [Burkholderiaceae bacterium]
MNAPARLGAFFGAYFAYVGLFSPYLPLWLNARGFSPAEIGVLISPMQWARVVGPPAWGWMADHVRSPHGVARLIQAAALAALVVSLGLLADLNFWSLFMLFCVLSFFLSGQVPIAESLAMQAGGGSLKRYGRMRVWGSVGFIVAVMLAGPWFDWLGIGTLPASLIAVLLLLVLASALLPHREVHDVLPRARLLGQVMRDRRIRAFLIASFLMLIAHAPLYTLFSLWLHQQGYSSTEIGLLWALGVVAEILMFQFQHRLFDRFTVGQCWVASYVVTVIRFLMIAFSGGSLLVIVLAQVLHAVTFGVHHSASMSLIRQWFPAQAQARGQAFYTMASYGLGGSIGGITAGWLWEAVSPEFVFIVSATAALVGTAVAASGLARLTDTR